ncbi:MAG: glycosyltransferase family 39 protein [Gemmatimonadota bacterium]
MSARCGRRAAASVAETGPAAARGDAKGAEARDVEGALGLPAARWALVAVALHLVLGLLLYDPTLFPGGDNAEYMILGESLRTGSGYRDIHLVGSPLHTKYPPVFPLLLAALGWLGGVQLFKLVSLALTAGSVWLVFALGRQIVGERTAFLAAGLLAVSPLLLEYSHYVLSEALFTLLVLAALLARGSENPAGRRAAVAAGAAAFLTRSAGLSLLAALAIHPLLLRRRREAAASLLAALLILVGWGLFQRLGPPGQPGYVEQLLLVNPYEPQLGQVGPAGLLARAASNLWLYVSAVLPQSLGIGGGPGPFAANPLVVLFGAVAAGLALSGWLREATRGITLTGLFTLFYLGLITLWPSVWTDRRFLLPVLPILLLYLLDGVGALGSWALRRWSFWWPAGAFVGLAVPAILSAGRLIPGRVECVRSYRAGAPCDPPGMASFYAAARWASQNTPPGAVIANRKPDLFFLFARRQGGLYRFSAEPAVVLRGLEELGASYVVVDQISLTTDRYLIPTIRMYRDRFEPVYSGGDPPTLILRFEGNPLTAAARAGTGAP